MRPLILLLAASALGACARERQADPPIENDIVAADVAAGNDAGAASTQPSLARTTWEFTLPGSNKVVRESIDEAGNYVAVVGTEHFDHGTAVMKDGKTCFTSAMNDRGEECWSGTWLAIGQSGIAISDRGEKLTIKRTEYVPLTM